VVTLGRSPRLVSGIQWYASLGPPFAWVVQLFLGYAYAEATCGAARVSAGVGFHLWQVIVGVAMALVAGGGWAGAIALHAAVGKGEVDDPLGRVRFMSTLGIVVGTIFVTLILYTLAGTLALGGCRP
jgi:hypothetical protein